MNEKHLPNLIKLCKALDQAIVKIENSKTYMVDPRALHAHFYALRDFLVTLLAEEVREMPEHAIQDKIRRMLDDMDQKEVKNDEER